MQTHSTVWWTIVQWHKIIWLGQAMCSYSVSNRMYIKYIVRIFAFASRYFLSLFISSLIDDALYLFYLFLLHCYGHLAGISFLFLLLLSSSCRLSSCMFARRTAYSPEIEQQQQQQQEQVEKNIVTSCVFVYLIKVKWIQFIAVGCHIVRYIKRCCRLNTYFMCLYLSECGGGRAIRTTTSAKIWNEREEKTRKLHIYNKLYSIWDMYELEYMFGLWCKTLCWMDEERMRIRNG